jgi:single-strand DNA-binding protein
MKNLANQVQLIGRLGMEPELINLPSGGNLLRMTLATNEYYRDREGEFQEVTQWHSLKAWGKLAEIMAERLSKGAQIIIHGKLEHRSYETVNGEKRKRSEVKIDDFALIKASKKTQNSKKQKMEEVEELPF